MKRVPGLPVIPLDGSPIYLDDSGILRVGKGKVPFLRVVEAFHQGKDIEQVMKLFPLDYVEAREAHFHAMRARWLLEAYLAALPMAPYRCPLCKPEHHARPLRSRPAPQEKESFPSWTHFLEFWAHLFPLIAFWGGFLILGLLLSILVTWLCSL